MFALKGNRRDEHRIRVRVIGRLEVLVSIVLSKVEAASPFKLKRPDAEHSLLRWLGVVPHDVEVGFLPLSVGGDPVKQFQVEAIATVLIWRRTPFDGIMRIHGLRISDLPKGYLALFLMFMEYNFEKTGWDRNHIAVKILRDRIACISALAD